MMRMKSYWNQVIKNALRAMPEIPYINEKKTSSVLPFVLGAFGAAVVGGIAAVMFFSPRTRTRALGVAKDTYDKVHDQIGNTAIGQKLGVSGNHLANGQVSTENSYASTGL